jgi:hypothetical protein
MGDILKMRFLRSLKLPTCRITDIASITKTPPMITSSSSCLVQMAAVPSAPPIASEPVSPMNTLAGWQLNHRKPKAAPASAIRNTESSPMYKLCGITRYSTDMK